MKVSVVGCGYVGLVTGACLAEIGHEVICLDINRSKINDLKRGKMPIFEKGLSKLVESNLSMSRLSFTSSYKQCVSHAKVIFLAVDTPQKKNGDADLSNLFSAVTSIAKLMNNEKIVVEKSTVPVGTSELLKKKIDIVLKKRSQDISYSVVSNPEFLKEGVAVDDFMKPDRIIIGLDDEKLKPLFNEIYQPFNRKYKKIQYMSVKAAELTKYASNSLLATKISFINEIANMASLLNVDIEDVRQGVGSDHRIGNEFLYPGLGYGGSCFPKDVKALIAAGKKKSYTMPLLESVDKINFNQRKLFLKQIYKYYRNIIKGKKLVIWGLSFKPGTDDVREAPSIDIIKALLKGGAKVYAYDPIASVKSLINHLNYHEVTSSTDSLKNSDGLIICTEWKEFWSIDVSNFLEMKDKVIFDGRNIYDLSKFENTDISYIGIGRSNTT